MHVLVVMACMSAVVVTQRHYIIHTGCVFGKVRKKKKACQNLLGVVKSREEYFVQSNFCTMRIGEILIETF